MYSGPKNSKSALFALAAAGGLWAWRNRDKIQGWVNSQRSQTSNRLFTGETRRMEESHIGSSPSTTNPRKEPFTSDI